MPDNLPRRTDDGDSATPLSTTPLSAEAAAQFSALQSENAKLRAKLVAMQQLALAPRQETSILVERRWLGRAIQVMILLVGVALGALYVRVSNDDIARGMRDGYRDASSEASRGTPLP